MRLETTHRTQKSSLICHTWHCELVLVCVLLQAAIAVLPLALAAAHPAFAPTIARTSLTAFGRGWWSEDDDFLLNDRCHDRTPRNRQFPVLQTFGLDTTALPLPTTRQREFTLQTLSLSLVFHPLKLSPASSSDDDLFLS